MTPQAWDPNGRFFIIKSYTEEDVHKAMKYKIWSSTEKGNNILTKALASHPVYLLFSVNKSKKFCGVARMMSPARQVTCKNLWKQSGRWPGSIDIEWIFIKDVQNQAFVEMPNRLNEDKPACQGRDCQEICPIVANEMMNIFQSAQSHRNMMQQFPFFDQ